MSENRTSLTYAAMEPNLIVTRDPTLIFKHGRFFITEIEQVGASTTRREIDVTEEVKKALR